MFRSIWRPLLLALLIVSDAWSAEPPPAAPGSDRPSVDIDSLRFANEPLRKRFTDFDATAKTFAKEGFQHRPYQLGGNFVTAVWAKGFDFTLPLLIRETRETFPGIHRIKVDTIVVPPPEAKSAALEVEVVTKDPNDWSLMLMYREATQQGVTGPAWGIVFYRWDEEQLGHIFPFRPMERAKESLSIPPRYYVLGAGDVRGQRERPIDEDFVWFVQSAEGMRDAFLTELAKLEKGVRERIASGQVQKRVRGKYRGDGRPPPSRLVALSAEELKEEQVKAERHFAVQEKLMREHHKAMYAALRKSFPLERCWAGLKADE